MNEVNPVLPSTLPVKSFAIPPDPIVMVGNPLTMMFPPVLVPAAVSTPALRMTALALVLVVLMLSLNVKSPDVVLMNTSPDDQIPLGFTEPMVSAFVSRYTTDAARDDGLPAASVVTLFDVLLRVNVPVPMSANPLPVTAAACVTAPVALSETLLLVAVRAAPIAMSSAYITTGPVIVALVANVRSAVLPDLPSVKPVRLLPKLKPVVENAPVKLPDAGSMVNVPAPVNPLEFVEGTLFCNTTPPPLIVVAPEYVPFAVSVRVLLPDLVTAPLPEIAPANVTESLRLNVSVPLFVTFPTMDPTDDPPPTLRVPAVIVVPPE